MNRPKITVDGAICLTSDTELFMPLSDDPQQSHIRQWRLRNGIGYRMNFNTRLEALYIWTTKTDSDTDRIATKSQAIDFRVTLAF